MLNKKRWLIAMGVGVFLIVSYIVAGRHIPIHVSEHEVGDKRLFYEETSRFIHCDLAFTEVVVHEDDTYEYVYPMESIGNGSCVGFLYAWDGLKAYELSEAVDLNIISLEDFLESDLVIKREKTAE